MSIKIYTTPSCPYCVQAKKYFEEKNLKYQEIDVSRDQKAVQEMIDLSGQMGVPVIVIDGKPIIGFDEEKINSLLLASNK